MVQGQFFFNFFINHGYFLFDFIQGYIFQKILPPGGGNDCWGKNEGGRKKGQKRRGRKKGAKKGKKGKVEEKGKRLKGEEKGRKKEGNEGKSIPPSGRYSRSEQTPRQYSTSPPRKTRQTIPHPPPTATTTDTSPSPPANQITTTLDS